MIMGLMIDQGFGLDALMLLNIILAGGAQIVAMLALHLPVDL